MTGNCSFPIQPAANEGAIGDRPRLELFSYRRPPRNARPWRVSSLWQVVFIVSVFAVGHGRKSIFGARVDLRVGQPANASHEQRSLSSSLPDQRIAPRVEYRQHDNPLFFRLEKYRVRKTTPMVIYRSSIQAGLDGGFNLPPRKRHHQGVRRGRQDGGRARRVAVLSAVWPLQCCPTTLQQAPGAPRH